jgi:hypothetical protein
MRQCPGHLSTLDSAIGHKLVVSYFFFVSHHREDPPAMSTCTKEPVEYVDKSNIEPTGLLHKNSKGQTIVTPYEKKKKLTTVHQAKMKVNIPWDSNERIEHISTPEQFIAHIEENEKEEYDEVPYSNVTSWTRARFDPDDAEYVVDPSTKMF